PKNDLHFLDQAFGQFDAAMFGEVERFGSDSENHGYDGFGGESRLDRIVEEPRATIEVFGELADEAVHLGMQRRPESRGASLAFPEQKTEEVRVLAHVGHERLDRRLDHAVFLIEVPPSLPEKLAKAH